MNPALSGLGSPARARSAHLLLAWVALLVALLDSTTARGQTASEPAQPPPAATSAPPVAVGAGDCLTAAPACFEGCPQNHVRTARGLCVPAAPPVGTSPRGGVVVSSGSARPASVTSSTSAKPSRGEPSSSPTTVDAGAAGASQAAASDSPPASKCCYASLTIEAVGLKNLGNRLGTQTLQLELKINGQIVGHTPFADELPASDYLVEIEGANREVHSTLLKLRQNASGHVRAEFSLPLDEAEARERFAWRFARVERARYEERAEFARVHSAWDAETRAAREQRTQRRTLGFIAAGAGAALLATGVVLEVVAAASNDEAESARSEWLSATDPQERSSSLQRAQDAEDARDTEHALGLGSLGVGAAALAVGGTLLITAPRVPDEPQFRPSWTSSRSGTLRLRTGFAPTAARLVITLDL